jgi:hypothetical protein
MAACLAGACPIFADKTFPNITSSTSLTSIFDLFTTSFITIPPKSTAVKFLYCPPNDPIAVLQYEIIPFYIILFFYLFLFLKKLQTSSSLIIFTKIKKLFV